jgi:hypothetical protein
MKKLVVLLLMYFPLAVFAGNNPDDKSSSFSVKTKKLPDLKVLIRGTPHAKSVGHGGLAIQCLYPFDRECLLVILKGPVIAADKVAVLKTAGVELPPVAEYIDENTTHVGFVNQSGAFNYYQIQNYKVSIIDGIFQLEIFDTPIQFDIR